MVMDADLQDPPEVVLEMAERWREGFEVVSGVRDARDGESWFKRATARRFYRMLGRMGEIEIPQDAGDFRLVDRRALDAVRSMREHRRYLRGMFAWVGYDQTAVHYRRDPRHAGATKFSLRRMVSLNGDNHPRTQTRNHMTRLHDRYSFAPDARVTVTVPSDHQRPRIQPPHPHAHIQNV